MCLIESFEFDQVLTVNGRLPKEWQSQAGSNCQRNCKILQCWHCWIDKLPGDKVFNWLICRFKPVPCQQYCQKGWSMKHHCWKWIQSIGIYVFKWEGIKVEAKGISQCEDDVKSLDYEETGQKFVEDGAEFCSSCLRVEFWIILRNMLYDWKSMQCNYVL